MTGRELYDEYVRITKRLDGANANGLVAYDHMQPIGRMIMDSLASFVNLHNTKRNGQTIDIQSDVSERYARYAEARTKRRLSLPDADADLQSKHNVFNVACIVHIGGVCTCGEDDE